MDLTDERRTLCALFSHAGRIFFMAEQADDNLSMLHISQRTHAGEVPQPVEWTDGGVLRLVDQSLSPLKLEYIDCRSVDDLASAIRSLKVRGAPAIGVASAYGLCVAANNSSATDAPTLIDDLTTAAAQLRTTRPTAVNLAWALDTVMMAARAATPGGIDAVKRAVLDMARHIDAENQAANSRMGEFGAALLRDGMNVLTHCNTGPLAAGGIGSAL